MTLTFTSTLKVGSSSSSSSKEFEYVLSFKVFIVKPWKSLSNDCYFYHVLSVHHINSCNGKKETQNWFVTFWNCYIACQFDLIQMNYSIRSMAFVISVSVASILSVYPFKAITVTVRGSFAVTLCKILLKIP